MAYHFEAALAAQLLQKAVVEDATRCHSQGTERRRLGQLGTLGYLREKYLTSASERLGISTQLLSPHCLSGQTVCDKGCVWSDGSGCQFLMLQAGSPGLLSGWRIRLIEVPFRARNRRPRRRHMVAHQLATGRLLLVMMPDCSG
jgi:hypothetical protein